MTALLTLFDEVAGYDPAAMALFDRMTVKPTTQRKDAYNKLITSLRAAGIWNKLDVLWVLAAHDSQASRLNLKSAAYTCTVTGAPVFTVDRGWQGNLNSGYLDTGYAPVGASQFTQNSFSSGSFTLTSQAANRGDYGNASHTIAPQTSSSNGTGYGNGDGSLAYKVGEQWGIGMQSCTRSASNVLTAYRNGQPVSGNLTFNQPALEAQNWLICARNGSSVLGTTRTVSMVWAGAALTDAEQLAFYNAAHDYIQAVGWKYEAETEALLFRMTNVPVESRIGLMDNFIKTTKGGGVWSKLDGIWFTAAPDTQAASLNWKGVDGTLTAVNSPSFVVDRGYQGNASTNYLDTNLAPSVGPNLQLNAAHVGIYCNLTSGANSSMYDCGGGNLGIKAHDSTNQFGGRVNSGAITSTASPAANTALGHSMAVRTSENDISWYKNAVLLGSNSLASVNVPTVSQYILGLNGSGTLVNASNRRVACNHWGGVLTPTEATLLGNAIITYLTAIGANA